MKKTLLLLPVLLMTSSLAGCDGGTEQHEHTFKQEWETNETHHWHNASCEHTDLVKDLNTHKFGDDNVCNDCGYTKPTPIIPHEHTFAEGWTHDETNHWHAATCEHTELTSGLAAHKYGDDNVCDDCGYEKPAPVVPHEHSFSEDWSKDETNHWHAATCEHTELTSGLAAHNYGYDNICDDCGYTKPAPAHEHTFATEWSKDETNHWHAATCEHTELTSGLGAHNFGDDNVCDDCGYEYINKYYSVIWKNYDGEILEIDNEVLEGTTPTCQTTPTKDDGGHVFNFTGWSPEVEPINKNMVFTANFEQDMSQKLVIFKDDLGNELNRQLVLVGEEPDMTKFTYKGIIENDKVKVLTGWDKPLGKIYEDTTFVGSYETYKKTYTKDEIEVMLTAEVFGNNISFEYSYGTETAISWTKHIALSNGVYKEYDDPDENYSYSETYADSTYLYELFVDYGQEEMCRKRKTPYSPESRVDSYLDGFVNDADYVYDEDLDLYVSENSYKTVWLKFKDGKVCFLRYEFKQILGWFDTLEITGVGDVPSITIPSYEWQTDEGPEHEHTFASDWSHDETNHWHAATCEHTEFTSGLGAHIFGDDNVCDTCGYVKVVHIHSFSTEWSMDENKHWHAATCGHDDVTNFGSHTYGDDNICTVCGFKKIEKHTITYVGWPDGIENPNPTEFIRTDDFILDGSPINAKEGLINAKFFVDSVEVTTLTGIDKDVTVSVTYDASITTITFDPNNGEDESVIIDVPYWSIPSELIDEYTRENHLFLGWFKDNGDRVDVDEHWIGTETTLNLTAKWKFERIDQYIENIEDFEKDLVIQLGQLAPMADMFPIAVRDLENLLDLAKNELLIKDYSKDEADVVYEKHTTDLNEKAVSLCNGPLSMALTAAYNKRKTELALINADRIQYLDVVYYSFLGFANPEKSLKEVIQSWRGAVTTIEMFL